MGLWGSTATLEAPAQRPQSPPANSKASRCSSNQTKSRVRAKVEHTIGVIKRVFGFQKVRYRGLAKNLHRLEVTAALTNLHMVRRRLLAT